MKKHSKSLDDIHPLQHQDLMYVVNTLPKVDFLDHEEMVYDHYRSGGWISVDAYADFVREYDREMNYKPSNIEKTIVFVRKNRVWIVRSMLRLKRIVRQLARRLRR